MSILGSRRCLRLTEVNAHRLFVKATALPFLAVHRVLSSTSTVNDRTIYLHVGPSGDSWIGDALFAAKHNPPGYVKSLALSDNDVGDDDEEGSRLIEALEARPDWAQEIYDTECLPDALRRHMKALHNTKS